MAEVERRKRIRTEKISTGSYDLNKWLYGGYETDVVTMIAGPPGSGKTNFCILAACSQAKKGNKVAYMDTEGGFSVERVKQITGDENYEKILENILVLEPVSFDEQLRSFSDLLKKIKKEHIGLIVVDGMATLYRLELGEHSREGDDDKIKELNRKVAQLMRILAEIARKQKIPVIVTNQVYHDFLTEEERRQGVEKEVHFVGGDILKYWSKCILELRNERGKRKAVLLKHRSMPQKEMSFEIRNLGIFRKGWL